MKAHIQKWGNSMALRIPKIILQELGLMEYREVELHVVDGELRVRPSAPPNSYTLEELVNGISPDNRHELVELDEPRGKEIW